VQSPIHRSLAAFSHGSAPAGCLHCWRYAAIKPRQVGSPTPIIDDGPRPPWRVPDCLGSRSDPGTEVSNTTGLRTGPASTNCIAGRCSGSLLISQQQHLSGGGQEWPKISTFKKQGLAETAQAVLDRHAGGSKGERSKVALTSGDVFESMRSKNAQQQEWSPVGEVSPVGTPELLPCLARRLIFPIRLLRDSFSLVQGQTSLQSLLGCIVRSPDRPCLSVCSIFRYNSILN
jgi:hypothetical protein